MFRRPGGVAAALLPQCFLSSSLSGFFAEGGGVFEGDGPGDGFTEGDGVFEGDGPGEILTGGAPCTFVADGAGEILTPGAGTFTLDGECPRPMKWYLGCPTGME